MKALVCGVTGQDGSYLARLLLSKGYEVWGTSRDAQTASLANFKMLSIEGKINLLSMTPTDVGSAYSALDASDPDEIYYLAGQSSVGLSFDKPVETLQSILTGASNMLEAVRLRKKSVRFFNAGSGECFGDTGSIAANELTPFHPRSPYGVAKAAAHWLVTTYRESYGLYACNGILFNHESRLRPQRFVTQKIIHAAGRIAAGADERLVLGRLDIRRDWGWAPEYVDVMWRMLQQDTAEDFILATGESNTLENFVAAAFAFHDLDWRRHVDISQTLFRPTEIELCVGDPSKAYQLLGWRAVYKMTDVIGMMSGASVPKQSNS
jgi:GDPmannose 4,6-dehydratase